MPVDAFLCPICSERQAPSGAAAFACSGCGSAYDPGKVDPAYRTLATLWSPDDSNGDPCVGRIAAALMAQNLPVNPLPKQSYDLKGGESLRLALVGDSILLAVATGSWSEELCLTLLNVLMTFSIKLETQGSVPRFMLVGPSPLPHPIRYIFAHTPQGRFERLAMGMSEIWNANEPVDPALTEELTRLAAKLVDLCFDVSLKGTIEDATPLNDLVLKRLRFPLSPADPLPGGAYIPASSLLLLGLLVGRAITASAHSPCAWAPAPESNFGLTLTTYIRTTGNRGQANVIDKMFKLYHHGAEDSVDFLAKHVVDESKP